MNDEYRPISYIRAKITILMTLDASDAGKLHRHQKISTHAMNTKTRVPPLSITAPAIDIVFR